LKYTDKLIKLRKILAVKVELAPGTTVNDQANEVGSPQLEIPIETDSSRCETGSLSFIQSKICEVCTRIIRTIPFASNVFKTQIIPDLIRGRIIDFITANPQCETPNLNAQQNLAPFINEFYSEWLKALMRNDSFISYKEQHNKSFEENDPFVDKSSNPFGLYAYDCVKAISVNTPTERIAVLLRLRKILSKLPKPPAVFNNPNIDKKKLDTIINNAIDALNLKANTVPENVRAKIRRIASANAVSWFDEICGSIGFGSPTRAREIFASAMEECVLEWVNSQNSKRPCMLLSSDGIIMSSSDEWMSSTFIACTKQKIQQRQDSCGN
jgi:hypothetical protein